MDTVTTLQTPMQQGSVQPYKAVHVLNTIELLRWWPFLREGFLAVSDMKRGAVDLTLDDFFGKMLQVLGACPDDALIVIFTSKKDKPLGYMVVENDSEVPSKRTALIYAGYSTGKYTNAPIVATAYVEHWARQHEFSELHVQSRRFSGAAMRLFRGKLAFVPKAVLLSKDL